MYFGVDEGAIVILLGGGDKDTQSKDIAIAKERWGDYLGMPRRPRPYEFTLFDTLRDPQESAAYLKAALEDSPEMFLVALKDVADAYQLSRLAKDAGVTRESLYKMLSRTGNPRYGSLTAVLQALGLKLSIEPSMAQTPTGVAAGHPPEDHLKEDTGLDSWPSSKDSTEATRKVVSITQGKVHRSQVVRGLGAGVPPKTFRFARAQQ